jgi:hypothetical protein
MLNEKLDARCHSRATAERTIEGRFGVEAHRERDVRCASGASAERCLLEIDSSIGDSLVPLSDSRRPMVSVFISVDLSTSLNQRRASQPSRRYVSIGHRLESRARVNL